jgi:glycerol-3-phosphate acyltransferase PlsX
MRLAVDAMGGDHAPAELVAGALRAFRKFPDFEVTLVGERAQIEAELEKLGEEPSAFKVRQASQAIGMDERPVAAVKDKPDSSIRQGIELVRDNEADGFLSAGNTGAVVAASILLLKKLPGVHRPGIAINFPTAKGTCTMIDVGANLNCNPTNLYQYGLMGSVFRQAVMGSPQPAVGLLNVGEEGVKGDDVLREAHALLADGPINFVGNVEGQQLPLGVAEVVVCDGFVGNALLKVCEGFAEEMLEAVRAKLRERCPENAACLGYVDAVAERHDYRRYGGGILLGVDGIAIICHGRSNARAIERAAALGRQFFNSHGRQKIVGLLERSRR